MHTQTQTQFSVDSMSRSEIQELIKLDRELDEAIITVTDEIAFYKLVHDMKQNPQLSKTEINSLAKKHLATEHGLEIEDLDENWDFYISDLIINANVFINKKTDATKKTN